MNRLKRILVGMLTAAMVVSSVPTQMVTAAEVSSESEETTGADSASEEADAADEDADAGGDVGDGITEGDEEQDATDDDIAETDADNATDGEDVEVEDSDGQTDDEADSDEEDDAADPTETISDEDEADNEETPALLNYLVVAKPYVELGQTQSIVVSVGDEDTVITDATLTYCRQSVSSEALTADAAYIDDDILLFEIDYTSESEKGIYILVLITYVVDGQEYTIDLSGDAGITATYGVEVEVETEADAEVVDEDAEAVDDSVSMSIVTFDEDGNQVSEQSIEEAIEDTTEEIVNEGSSVQTSSDESDYSLTTLANSLSSYSLTKLSTSSGNVVVVLDPGHDSTHTGASANGLKEEELTLKIAQYCKAELEEYNGVTVYMTRTTSACPYPSSSSSTVCNRSRVAYAASVGADVYVSIHLNAATNTSAKGAEVYYPNSNYNAEVGAEGKALASAVLEQLVALGLYNRGIKLNDDDGYTYPDGSVADDYTVINNSKLNGFPGIIIEHAFLTNSSDVSTYLSTESGLKSLGVADATGIANYFGLSKETEYSYGDADVSFSLNSAGDTYTISAANISEAYGVQFAVWSDANGQDDLVWYTATLQNGNWVATVPLTNHNTTGSYSIHTYIKRSSGSVYLVSADSWSVTRTVSATVTVKNTNTVSGTFDVVVSDVKSTFGVQSVFVPVWSKSDQSDIKWYTATKQSDGTYLAHVDVANHNCNTGTYHAHVYVKDYSSQNTFVGAKDVSLPSSTATITATVNASSSSVSLSAWHVPGTLGSSLKYVQFAVWSADGGQDDLKWYTGTLSGDTYTATVSLADHKSTGTYYVHVYAMRSNGSYQFVGNTTFTVSKPTASVSIKNVNTVSEVFDVVVSDITATGGVKKVQVPVWSKSDQSDIKWYTATKQSDGTYLAHVDVANHNCNTGTYKIHVYVTDGNGNMTLTNSTSITMTEPTATITASVNSSSGSVSLSAWHVPGTLGASLKYVQFAVWSADGGQDDLKWYTGTLSGDTYTATVSLADHKSTGTYYVHVYAMRSNGSYQFVGNTSFAVSKATATVTVKNSNSVSGVFDVVVSNITATGGVSKVQIPVWSKSDQSDIKWYTATKQSDGTYLAHVDVANHNCNRGTYQAHVYITDGIGLTTCACGTKADMTEPTATITATVNTSPAGIYVTAWHVPGTLGASLKSVKFAVWSLENGQDDLKWYTGTLSGDTYVYTVSLSNHSGVGTYAVHVYATYSNGSTVFVGAKNATVEGTAIMTTPTTTVSQMVSYYNANASYPSYYSSSDAPDITTFCQMYYDECVVEGVAPAVAFCQAMKETGFLKFGGDVSITQYNFCGLGATGGGAAGNSFSTVREGIRAHVQHLKAYASTDSLNNTCVDPRFSYVTRGSAPYVEWLGKNENPNGVGWATAVNYGYSIRDDYMAKLYRC
ncbi:MAG: GBS Bsp-like repeat-containing protein [Clostridiales bacterium]|nr:GBS Bsp-like repeat-containing protein [Clostridiales bacterium]